MKKILLLSFALIFISNSILLGQNKRPDVVLLFDYSTKQWRYEEIAETGNKKQFFILKYKSQPVIRVINLPKSNLIVKIDDQYYDVTPNVETNENLIDKSGDEIKKETGYSFSKTMPMVDSDEVVYTLTIYEDEEEKPLHSTEVFAKIYGKLKIDLSTGVLFHTLQDDSYYFTDAGNEQSSISKDRCKGKLKPQFPVVLTHIYRQSRGMLSPGLSLGLGLDDSGKAGYYAGGSLIFGDRQRAVISGGWAFRPKDVLKGKYTEGQVIPAADLPETTELVESVYKSGIFFSITYNLSSKVEKREKK